MASRDTQPRRVCRIPQQQLPGHSAADSFQGHAATDNVQGPSAAAPRALSSRQLPGTRSHGQRAGSLSSSYQGTQQRRLMQSCGDSQPLGIAEGYSPDLFGGLQSAQRGWLGRLGPPYPSLPASFREQDDSSS
ncbi:unnamed protein product, partial [Staurois parvus]